jgi:hypothetical protein
VPAREGQLPVNFQPRRNKHETHSCRSARYPRFFRHGAGLRAIRIRHGAVRRRAGHAPVPDQAHVFPGALDGLDLAAKKKVNATNARYHVKWIQSYATADKNLTFCVYEAPNEQAVRDAAKANGIPIDQIFAVPVTLMPTSKDVAED